MATTTIDMQARESNGSPITDILNMPIDTGPAVLEPHLPIIDSHHHLWLHPNERYLLDEYAADFQSGHNVVATVYVECNAMYRTHGPQAMRPVGEAEFVAGMAAISESGHYGATRACAAFVGTADLTLGAEAEGVLDALSQASGGRLRGIRCNASWDEDPSINTGVRPYAPKGLLQDSHFQAGVARLSERGLVYDAWQYHPQLDDLCHLADACPDTTIVVNHCGGLVRIGQYNTPDVFEHWLSHMKQVARRPNTVMKLGGLSPKRCGFAYDRRDFPPTAHDLACDWRPYIEACIEQFGPARCMFESNFPPDKVAGSYRTVWNAFKLIAAQYAASEKDALFSGTAQRIYRIEEPSI